MSVGGATEHSVYSPATDADEIIDAGRRNLYPTLEEGYTRAFSRTARGNSWFCDPEDAIQSISQLLAVGLSRSSVTCDSGGASPRYSQIANTINPVCAVKPKVYVLLVPRPSKFDSSKNNLSLCSFESNDETSK